MRRVLITGMSGSGKSTVLGELARRGYATVDTDEPGWTRWSEDASTLYVSGTVSNPGPLLPRFDAVVLLSAPAQVLLQRIETRTTNSYGKSATERELTLQHLSEVEPLLRASRTYELDATQTVQAIADELVAIAGASTPRDPH